MVSTVSRARVATEITETDATLDAGNVIETHEHAGAAEFSLDGMSVLKRKRDKGELACGIVLALSGVRYASDAFANRTCSRPFHISCGGLSRY